MTRRPHSWRAAAAALLAGAAVSPVPAQDPQRPFTPFDGAAFEAHLRSLGAADAELEAYRTDAAEVSVGAAADTALRALSADYDRAVALAEDGEPRAALALTKLLAATDDPYVRAHARYHLGRVFVDADDPERAAEVFASYLREDRNRTPLDAEVMYFYAHSLADIPVPALAMQAFAAFIEMFPQAPERYVASATQQLAELEGQIDSPLHDIADVMKGVERRIRKTDTGDETQKRQADVMKKLQKIIEQMEEQEQQSSGAPGGLGNPTAPASRSAAPPGKTRIGNIKKVPGVADRWNVTRDRDREAIENDLQTKLPGHYRRMLEEYYRKLGSGGQ